MQSISTLLLRRLLAVGESIGLSRRQLLAAAQLEPAVIDSQRIPASAYFEVWDAALTLAPRNVCLPVRVGTYLGPDEYGALGLAFKTAASLRAALDLAVRYLHALTEAASLQVTDEDGVVNVSLQRVGTSTEALAAANECTLVEIVHSMKNISGAPLGLTLVSLRHATSRSLPALEAFFGCPVTSGASENALCFKAESLEGGLPKSDEGLSRFLLEHLAKLVPQTVEGSFRAKLRDIIADALPTGRVALDAVARHMGTSGRSLQRQLAERGERFQTLLDEVRQELATHLLATTTMPIAEVSFLIGFADAAAFVRAFKRWTGSTPSAWRSTKALNPA